MKHLLFLFLLVCSPLYGAVSVNNRILTTVNGKSITLVDVVKKMDLQMLEHHRHHMKDPSFRYQFYLENWRQTFSDMLDKELVLLSASDYKMPLSPGDVRQEMDELFGQDILQGVEMAGLSYDEAEEIVRNEILTRRMLMWKVEAGVRASITPKEIVEAYTLYLQDIERDRKFSYHVLTVKGEKEEEALSKAQEIKSFIGKKPLEELGCTVSSLFIQKHKEMAKTVLEKLMPLQNGESSNIVSSKKGEEYVCKIYFLKERKDATPSSFEDMEAPLKHTIFQKKLVQKMDGYFKELRASYSVNVDAIMKDLPSDFQPFSIT